MRKRGKNYAGKWQRNPLAWQNAIAMQHGMTRNQLDDLGQAIHTGILRMRTGHGLEDDWYVFAAMANVSLILCERDVGSERIGIVYAVQDALMEIKARHERTGKWGFSGPEMQAINDAATLHEQQIANVPRAACRDALLEARRRAAQGHILERVPA